MTCEKRIGEEEEDMKSEWGEERSGRNEWNGCWFPVVEIERRR